MRIAVVVFLAAVTQVSSFSSLRVFGAAPDVLLVGLVSVALLRGALAGAVAGFAAGLIVDVATLGTLGVTSLLLTVAGYWAGRYGETTGRGRPQGPAIAACAITAGVGVAAYGLQFMLGETVSARDHLLPVLPAVAWSALLAYPVYRLVRRVVGVEERAGRAREVELVV
jgi:rod shape-determining protein MreD